MTSVGRAEANGILKRDADAGVPVHAFDPSASPEEKGAAASKGRDQLKNVAAGQGESGAQALPVQDGPPNVIPTITVQDTDEGSKTVASGTNQSAEVVQQEAVSVPGGYSTPPAPTIPDWYRVGWHQMVGMDDNISGEEKDKGVLDLFLKEQYYGDWFHNAAIIIFVSLPGVYDISS
ncbi:hypothetical protein C0993_012240 [Termitomyces sp. T159_Od127]|nr:hypothetical protein C0993_012240 [Termitomyces sp. T159_Od127]